MSPTEQVQLAVDILDKIVIPLVGLAIGWAMYHFGLKQQAETALARQDQVGAAARTAVNAVEQQMKGTKGQAKLAKAIDTTTAILAAHGVTITDAEKQAVEAAIEAEVGALNRYRSPAPVVVNNTLPAVTATPGPGQEAGVVVQPAPEAVIRNHPDIPIAEEPS